MDKQTVRVDALKLLLKTQQKAFSSQAIPVTIFNKLLFSNHPLNISNLACFESNFKTLFVVFNRIMLCRSIEMIIN